MRDISLLQLVVELLLCDQFYERSEFDISTEMISKHGVHGSGLLMMALEACNANVSHDIDGALEAFQGLSLEPYPGEKILWFTT
jgi:hypothetical protein